MTKTPGDFDVVVIGAGAAGLAAGRRLAAEALSFIIIEARERIGGRGLTRTLNGFPLDLGCGWLHSADRNPWVAIAESLGLSIDRSAPAWTRQSLDRGFSRQDQAAFAAASQAFHARLEGADVSAGDFPAARLLDPEGDWNALINAESAFMNGAELDRVSTQDWKRYADSGVNWRVAEGFGAAIKAYGAGLPVRTGCAVTLIDHEGANIRIETAQGRLSANAVILTIPTNLIAAEAIVFKPALPEKLRAADMLPLGLADKLVMTIDEPGLAIDEPRLPKGGHLFGDPKTTATGSYHLRPFGRPLIEGFFGGELARDLERSGPGGFFDFARGELRHLFGGAFAARLAPLSETAWGRDPFSRGSYSYARPGHSEARSSLAAPVDGRLFFAGEACSRHGFSTAHGAYASGVAAAEGVIAERRKSRA